jgi:SAM-dependent methyltransferase
MDVPVRSGVQANETHGTMEAGSVLVPAHEHPESIRFEDCFWYTTMNVPGHGVVRGDWTIDDFDQYVGGINVAGKSVVDVGCASGYLSFEAERRGARVTSFDAASMAQLCQVPFLENLYFRNRDLWDEQEESGPGLRRMKNSYWYMHQRLASSCHTAYGDLFRLYRSVDAHDIVIAGAILEHLNDQISAIASMARVAKEAIVIAFTSVLDTDEMIAKPILPLTNPKDDITWWVYSRGLYRRVLNNVGFDIAEIRSSCALHETTGELVNRETIIAKRSRSFSDSP